MNATRTNPSAAETAYIANYQRAMAAIQAIQEKIHDMPAPEGEVAIRWDHVGSMAHIADQLEELLAP